MKADVETSVVIVGGGPVGLALAGELGWRGHSVVVLEQSDGTVPHPKMDGIDLRVMEFCRRWGIVEEVRKYPFPSDYPQDMVFLTSLCGYELGRESFASPSGGTETLRDGPSPEVRVRCPQTFFDPVLRRFAQSFAGCDLRLQCKYTGFEQDADGVTVTYEDLRAGGERKVIRARYLVGCDGANSQIRSQLGVPFEGLGLFNYTTSVLFRTPDLFALHDKRLGYRHLFITPKGIRGSLSAINPRGDEWRAMFYVDQGDRIEGEELQERLREIVGCDFDYEIVSILHWARRELLAQTYQRGRVFLAGDACHATSPTGGFGMNTGIKDAVDLAWKLDAVMKGWGGPGLLESYTVERRPMGQRAIREASGNWQRMLTAGAHPGLLDPGYEGALLRYHVGRRFSATMLREWYKLGIDLGYIYESSPICCPDSEANPATHTLTLPEDSALDAPSAFFADGTPMTSANIRELQRLRQHLAEGTPVEVDWTELDAHEVMVYRQTSRPGARAPHVWLADGRSTLDLFGRDFTLLRIGQSPESGAPLVDAAKARRVPLTTVDCAEPAVAQAYRHPLILVRPDGHVAWRGSNPTPSEAAAVIDRVRGSY